MTKFKYFFGSDFRSIPYLATIHKSEKSIIVVTTQPIKKGRGNKTSVNPVEEYCKNNDIKFLYFSQDSVYENMDIGISASFAKIFSSKFLESNNSIFNIHLSLLPKLRGPTPVENSLLTNQTNTGFTVFRVDKDIDTGKIIYQKDITILETDYASDIYKKLSYSFDKNYKNINFENNGTTQTKNSSETSKFNKNDFNIADDNLLVGKTKIRAFNVMGPAFTTYQNKFLKIHSYTEERNSEGIMYKEGVLYPEYVTPEGKNKMLFPDYLRGLK